MKYKLYKAHTGERKVTALRELFKDEEGRKCEKLVALFYDSELAKKVVRWAEKDEPGGEIIEA